MSDTVDHSPNMLDAELHLWNGTAAASVAAKAVLALPQTSVLSAAAQEDLARQAAYTAARPYAEAVAATPIGRLLVTNLMMNEGTIVARKLWAEQQFGPEPGQGSRH